MGDVWRCKIGYLNDEERLGDLPLDPAMRRAVGKGFIGITGREPDFVFSGWGAKLTEGELAAHEDRDPKLNEIRNEAYKYIKAEATNTTSEYSKAARIIQGLLDEIAELEQ